MMTAKKSASVYELCNLLVDPSARTPNLYQPEEDMPRASAVDVKWWLVA